MNQRVERDNSDKAPVREVQSKQIAPSEDKVGVEARRHFNHPRGEVEAENVYTQRLEISAHLAGTASEIAYFSAAANVVGKLIEERAVERLAVEFVKKDFGIALCRGVIAEDEIFRQRTSLILCC